jgi:hypothetical protein
MPLTLPVDEEITQAVFERLEFVPGSTVVRPTKQDDEWTPEDLQIVLVKQFPVRVTELDHPGNPPAIAWMMRLNIKLHVMPSQHDELPPELMLSELAAAVMQTLAQNPQWHNWGGLAIDTQFADLEHEPSESGLESVTLPLEITYRVSETDPYQVRA